MHTQTWLDEAEAELAAINEENRARDRRIGEGAARLHAIGWGHNTKLCLICLGKATADEFL